ncbi:MAG: hypothetical protein KAG61_12210 [Bacteriovoracaceae bacterium]|nr:hypothetical protein [Bacteriovoracaceae bacterium]
MKDRKKDHIKLAEEAYVGIDQLDPRFSYEPLLSSHAEGVDLSVSFLGSKLVYPIWISSMTGGTGTAKEINQNLAKVAAKYRIGMGLGSIRPLLDNPKLIDDFAVRKYIGDGLPLMANIGIAQLEDIILGHKYDTLKEALDRLEVTGLIVHVNPMQEFIQFEGDRFKYPPIDTIKHLLDLSDYPVVVKEVGCGMGPESLKALCSLPLGAIEFAAFGGTNFSALEMLRNSELGSDALQGLSTIGHSADEMIAIVNQLTTSGSSQVTDFIVSGGVSSFLDGHYYTDKCEGNTLYGMAYRLLKYAESYDNLDQFMEKEVGGLEFARRFIRIKK